MNCAASKPSFARHSTRVRAADSPVRDRHLRIGVLRADEFSVTLGIVTGMTKAMATPHVSPGTGYSIWISRANLVPRADEAAGRISETPQKLLAAVPARQAEGLRSKTYFAVSRRRCMFAALSDEGGCELMSEPAPPVSPVSFASFWKPSHQALCVQAWCWSAGRRSSCRPRFPATGRTGR